MSGRTSSRHTSLNYRMIKGTQLAGFLEEPAKVSRSAKIQCEPVSWCVSYLSSNKSLFLVFQHNSSWLMSRSICCSAEGPRLWSMNSGGHFFFIHAWESRTDSPGSRTFSCNAGKSQMWEWNDFRCEPRRTGSGFFPGLYSEDDPISRGGRLRSPSSVVRSKWEPSYSDPR